MDIRSVVFATQQGTYMKSNKATALHNMLGKPLISYPIEACKRIGCKQTLLVVGEQLEDIKHTLQGQVEYAHSQDEFVRAIEAYQDSDDIILLSGHAPLLTEKTLSQLLEFHRSTDNSVTVLSALLDTAADYKRIVRREDGGLLKMVEELSPTDKGHGSNEVDGGVYVFKAKLLKTLVLESTANWAKDCHGENLIQRLIKEGYPVEVMMTNNASDLLRVNSRSQLAKYTAIMKNRINEKHMENGVTLEDPFNTYIESDVIIGQDTVIEPNCMLKGRTVIGNNCSIGYNTKIINTQISNGVHIENSQVQDSVIDEGATIGPFAYIRPGSKIGKCVKIGDFVEIKNSNIGDYTKVSHLTYVGDADVGKYVNFGCGSVLVNYDGVNKNRSTIEDYAFIGCNTNLVSPVTVGERAYTGAGSTITTDVPKESLGIARVKQVNKEGWVTRKYPKS